MFVNCFWLDCNVGRTCYVPFVDNYPLIYKTLGGHHMGQSSHCRFVWNCYLRSSTVTERKGRTARSVISFVAVWRRGWRGWLLW